MDWTLSHQKIQIKSTIRFQFILDRLAVIRKMNPYLVLVKMLNSSRTMEMRMIFFKKIFLVFWWVFFLHVYHEVTDSC